MEFLSGSGGNESLIFEPGIQPVLGMGHTNSGSSFFHFQAAAVEQRDWSCGRAFKSLCASVSGRRRFFSTYSPFTRSRSMTSIAFSLFREVEP